MDSQVTNDLGDRLARLDHDLHSLSVELRAELAAMVWRKQILSAERHYSESLVHLALSEASGLARSRSRWGGPSYHCTPRCDFDSGNASAIQNHEPVAMPAAEGAAAGGQRADHFFNRRGVVGFRILVRKVHVIAADQSHSQHDSGHNLNLAAPDASASLWLRRHAPQLAADGRLPLQSVLTKLEPRVEFDVRSLAEPAPRDRSTEPDHRDTHTIRAGGASQAQRQSV